MTIFVDLEITVCHSDSRGTGLAVFSTDRRGYYTIRTTSQGSCFPDTALQ